MPGFVKTKKDEKDWKKAKKRAGEDEEGEPKWALANFLFQQAKKSKKPSKK